MSGKLYLPARVPNEGAHRLACWLLATRTAAVSEARIAEARRELGAVMLDRLLAGEILPGMLLGAKLMRMTGGRVQPRQFQRATGRRWSDAPAWDARRPESIQLRLATAG